MAEFRALIPLDGSTTSETSLAYLPLLQAFGDLRVRLMSVVGFSGHAQEHTDSPGEQDLTAYLLHHQIRLTAAIGVVETVVRNGPPSLAIVAEANSFGADMILISTHGRSGIDRWRMGSITEQVARQAYTDVLVVPANEACEAPRIQSILVPLDGSVAGETAIPVARDFAGSLRAQLHLVHVVAPSSITAGHGASHQAQVAQGRTYLIDKQAEYGVKDATLTVLSGPPDDSIVRYCESAGIDLVALTAHGAATGSRVGLGRVAERVLRWDRPALLVRPEQN